jgi:hypothetical protein
MELLLQPETPIVTAPERKSANTRRLSIGRNLCNELTAIAGKNRASVCGIDMQLLFLSVLDSNGLRTGLRLVQADAQFIDGCGQFRDDRLRAARLLAAA